MTTVKPMPKHIGESFGPDTNISKFYITQYSSTYGKRWEHFKPRTCRPTGTGYSANIRPQVFYSKDMDEKDNPTMAALVATNYYTTNNLAYQPYTGSRGRDPFPRGVYQSGTGFVRGKSVHVPESKDVNGVHIDTRVKPGFCDTLPRHVPLLHKLRGKDPVELENQRYGPASMSSETKTRFMGDPTDNLDRSVRTLGPNTETGFTHNKNIEPVTFYPDFAHKNDNPAWMTGRPIGSSVTKNTFVPMGTPSGREPFGVVTPGSNRGSAFTQEKPKPAYLHPGKFGHPQSMTQTQFTGQGPAKTMPAILGTADVGPRTETGFLTNNDGYQFSADNPQRFLTEHMHRFKDPDSRIQLDNSFTRFNVLDRKDCGFCRGSRIHAGSLGKDPNPPTIQLNSMEPYQARSIKARDIFHDDHTYDHKVSKSVTFASDLTRSKTIA